MTQPHFDDEQTVLAARPVVPLEQLDAKLKHRRRWFLGGAFVAAMLLGAATAVVSAYLRIRNVPDPQIQSSSVSEESLTPVVPEIENPVVKVTTPKPVKRKTVHTDTNQAVLIDQWQERRPRRVETRDRRQAQHHDRDLSNINEIFEGQPRP